MYSHMTSRVNKNVCMYVCKSERSLGKSLWKRKHTSDHTLGKSLLTSLFKFLLISVRVNPWKTSLCTQSSFKSWKSLLILSSLGKFQLFAIHKNGTSYNQKLRHCWVAKTLMSSYSLCKDWVFKENFSETIRYIGLKISEITEFVMLFQYLEISFY